MLASLSGPPAGMRAVSPTLSPLEAQPLVGAAAEAAAHHADEEAESAVEEARAVPSPIPGQPTAREV